MKWNREVRILAVIFLKNEGSSFWKIFVWMQWCVNKSKGMDISGNASGLIMKERESQDISPFSYPNINSMIEKKYICLFTYKLKSLRIVFISEKLFIW